MGIIIKQGLKASLVSYIGILIGAFNNLFLFPLYLGKEGIGLINVIYASAVLFLPVLQLGLPTSLVKYFPIFRDKPFLSSFLTYSLFLPVTIYIVFIAFWPFVNDVFAIVFSKNATLIYNNIFWVLPLLGILIFLNIFEAFARVSYRIAIPTFARSVFWRILQTILVLLIGFGIFSSDSLVPLYVITWGITFLLVAVYAIKIGKLKFSWNKSFLRSTYFKEFNSFSAFVVLLAAGGILVQRIDQLMVASFLGTDAAGVFTLAIYFATLIEIPRRSINGIVQPVLADAFKNGDEQKIYALYKKSSLNLLLIGGVIFILIWSSIDEIFQVIPHGDDFIPGIPVVFFYGLARVVDLGTGCNQEILTFSKHYKVNLVFTFLLVGLVILTNWMLIPKYGIDGAAIATFLSMSVHNFLRYFYLLIKMKLQPFGYKSILVLLLLVAFFMFGEFLQLEILPVWSIIIKSIIIGIPLLTLVYCLKISTEINSFITRFFGRIKKRNN